MPTIYRSMHEMGLDLQKKFPAAYASEGMTPTESASAGIRLHPEWKQLIDWDIPGEITEMPSMLGTAAALELRGHTGAMAPLAGLALSAPNWGQSALDVGVETAKTLLSPTGVRGMVKGIGSVVEGAGRSLARGLGTRDDSLLGNFLMQPGGGKYGPEGGGRLMDIPSLESGPTSLHPSELAAQAAWDDVAKVIDPVEWVNNPAENFLRIGFGSGIARAMRFPSLAEAINAMNPALRVWAAAPDLAGKAGIGPKFRGLAGVASEELPGVLAGVGGEAVRELYALMRQADPAGRDAFFAVMNEKNPALHAFATIESMLKKIEGDRSKRWREVFPNLQMTGTPEAMHEAIRMAVRDALREHDVRGVPEGLDAFDYDRLSFGYKSGVLDGPDQTVIKEWIKAIEEEPSFQPPKPPKQFSETYPFVSQGEAPPMKLNEFANEAGEYDIGSFDSMRKTAWNTRDHVGQGHTSAKALMGSAYDKIRNLMIKHVIGYEEMLSEWKRLKELTDDFRDSIGLTSSMDLKQVKNKRVKAIRGLVTSLRSNPGSEATKSIIKEVEALTGIPAMPAALGALFNNWIGTGIISRSEMAGMIGIMGGVAGTAVGVSTGGAIGAGVLLTMLQLPLVSPRAFASFVAKPMGWTWRQWNAFKSTAQSIYDKVPDGWDKDSLTLFAAAQRLEAHLRAQEASDSTKSPKPPDSTPYTSLSAGLKQ